MADTIDSLLRRQRVLADFGDFALESETLDEVLGEACRLVGAALGTSRAKVLEIDPGGDFLLVRAGIGWGPGIVGHMRVPMDERSSESYSIEAGVPVVSQDVVQEQRFEVPDFMQKAGVVALANVPIFLPGGKAYGLLQVDDTRPRDFGEGETEFLRTYATILGPVIDRLLKLDALRSSEERFRIIVETATDYAIFTADGEDRIVDWLPGAAAVFGWTAEEATGRPASLIFTPEDRQRGEDAREIATARREGRARDVRWHLRKDGARVFVEGSVWALRDAQGMHSGFLKIGRDATDRRATEERLRESEERFRHFGEASSDVLWIRDAQTLAHEYLSAAFETTYGIPRDEALGDGGAVSAMEAVEPADREALHDLLRQARAGQAGSSTYRITRRSDGAIRWMHSSAFPLFDAQNRVRRIGGIAHDATEEIETKHRLQVVAAELQHRTRNLLGVVQAVSDRTVAGASSLEDFRLRFRDRLDALVRVNTSLSRLERGERVTFDQLLRTELLAHGAVDADGRGAQVGLAGPDGVTLRSGAVQILALALHELTTNALKYGALAQPEGRLDVRWDLVAGPAGSTLRVEWRESGVSLPPPAGEGEGVPPPRRGYGRELIEQALPYQLGAETTYDLGPGGVVCTIALPVRKPARPPAPQDDP